MQNINFCHFSDYKEFLKFLFYNNAESLQYPCESCYRYILFILLSIMNECLVSMYIFVW